MSRIYYRFCLSFFISIIGLYSCSRGWHIVPAKRMVAILIDKSIAEAYMQNDNIPDSLRARVYLEIYHKYGISKRDWDSTISYLGRKHMDNYQIIYQVALDSINNLKKQLVKRQNIKDSIHQYRLKIATGAIDSINILANNHHTKDLLYTIGYFEINNIHQDDSGINDRWQLSTHILTLPLPSKNTDIKLRMNIKFRTQTDTTVYTNIIDTGKYKLSIVLPHNKKIEQISGGIYLNQIGRRNQIVVTPMSLMRLHDKKSKQSIPDSIDRKPKDNIQSKQNDKPIVLQ